MDENIEQLLKIFDDNEEVLKGLEHHIHGQFLSNEVYPIIHSIKSRKKKRTHLKEKILKKIRKGSTINQNNFFNEITDLVGVRILLLYPQYFKDIHEFILNKANRNDWILHEDPIAYTWDPETELSFINLLNIKDVRLKESYYTSIHYVVKPNKTAPCCEIQVRTLLEELWGEIDHNFNYPNECDNEYLQDSLKALAKLIASGTKLTEIIYKMGNSDNLNQKLKS